MLNKTECADTNKHDYAPNQDVNARKITRLYGQTPTEAQEEALQQMAATAIIKRYRLFASLRTHQSLAYYHQTFDDENHLKVKAGEVATSVLSHDHTTC